ncbi:uncharacterized protein EV420DRAFT_1543166 [Desarmillaria tabescens]|uniref:Uncharacterized protein n=1 Tax=Armillaria tabescens TaxID=1929756 RepID=A0AA39N564_ARMTA|nr:uncharacterized protein EV420DRAFT_1543166 [Desarmillaria tabescens]KAK0458566.1 hypothetical protein EV420DRAFT_1543166 [Desarmillaria tabescens]
MFASPVSSPVLHTPSHRPIKSSPLASQSTSPLSPTFSSPLSAAQARRKLQYKTYDSYTPEQSQKEFLRQRFQTRCFQRAAKARESAVKRKRHVGSDDVFDDVMDDDKEETEDEVLKDEFFKRIVDHAKRRTQHAYKLSYADEVGSSLDPDMEDLDSESREGLTPEEREIAELQAYADECELQAALADFEDIPEEFWNDSDLEEAEVEAMDVS